MSEELQQLIAVNAKLDAKLDQVLLRLSQLEEERDGDKKYSISEVCKRLKIGRRRLETLVYRFHLNIDTRRACYADGCVNPKISFKQFKEIEKVLKIQRGEA